MELLKFEELIYGFEEYVLQYGFLWLVVVEVGKCSGEKFYEELIFFYEVELLYEWGNFYVIFLELEKYFDFCKVNLSGY